MELADLRKIGLTEGELKIYDALLDLGESTRTRLAKKSGISPSKIYDVCNRLLEKGIISSVKKNSVLHFSAAEPNKLNDFLQQKEDELKKERKVVSQLLPMLMQKYGEHTEETDVEVFYGWEGMTTVFDTLVNTLEKGEYNYIFGASSGHDSNRADTFFVNHYHKKRGKGFGTKIIFNDNVRSNKVRTAPFKKPPHEMRFLHQDTFAEINLYRNTVLLIMLLKKPLVIRITNQEAADSFKTFFDTMWEQAVE